MIIAHFSAALALVGVDLFLSQTLFVLPKWIHVPGQVEFDRSDYAIGLTGKANVSINNFGLRGRSRPYNTSYSTLVLGSSGTFGWMLDDSEIWSRKIEKRLNKENPNAQIWVANAAKPGSRLQESYTQLNSLYEEGLEFDLVLVVAGANELFAKMYQGSNYSTGLPEDPRKALKRAFVVAELPTYSALLNLLFIRRQNFARQSIPEENFFARARRFRKNGVHLSVSPNLEEVEHDVRTTMKKLTNSPEKMGRDSSFSPARPYGMKRCLLKLNRSSGLVMLVTPKSCSLM